MIEEVGSCRTTWRIRRRFHMAISSLSAPQTGRTKATSTSFAESARNHRCKQEDRQAGLEDNSVEDPSCTDNGLADGGTIAA